MHQIFSHFVLSRSYNDSYLMDIWLMALVITKHTCIKSFDSKHLHCSHCITTEHNVKYVCQFSSKILI